MWNCVVMVKSMSANAFDMDESKIWLFGEDVRVKNCHLFP